MHAIFDACMHACHRQRMLTFQLQEELIIAEIPAKTRMKVADDAEIIYLEIAIRVGATDLTTAILPSGIVNSNINITFKVPN